MSRYNEMEKIIAEQGEKGLQHLEFYNSFELELSRQLKNDVFSNVHGKLAGGPVSKIKDFIGVLVGDDFFAASDSYTGNFTQGYLFTREEDILEGDVLKIKTDNSKIIRYRIDRREELGFTTKIFTKWKISALGS